MPTFGYAGKILRVDLSSGNIAEVSTLDYADRFLGGRGIATKVYWDEVLPEVGAFDAENRLIFTNGPLCGLSAIAGSRWQVSGKSPTTPEQFSYCNLGGRWGAELKFAGYDGIIVQGKSEKPAYLFLHDETAELKDASTLWGKGSIETREFLKGELGGSTKVVAIGPAGENMVVMASLLADNDASGSGGLGAVMGAKKLKAIAVKGAGKGVKVAQPQRWRELIGHYRGLGRSFPSEGWEYLSRWSRHPMLEPKIVPGPEMKKEPCYGCLGRCARRVYESPDGRKGKFICHSAFFYQPWAERYYGDWNDVPFYATKLCDSYGLDAVAIDLMISWLHGCYEAGILTDENTGIPLSRLGSLEFIEDLVRKVSLRDGFGDVLAKGIEKAADVVGPAAKEQVEMAGYLAEPGYHPYGPRLYIANALLYAMEPRIPIQQLHETGLLLAKWAAGTMGLTNVSSEVIRGVARRFWGSETAADFSTYEGKALATKRIQDRQYANECLILCNFLWPITDCERCQGGVGDPALESKVLSAVLEKEIDEEGLYKIGERVFNLQRAILVREGHRGRDFDILPDGFYTLPLAYDQANPECLVPGKDGKAISRKGAVVNRDEFEKMKDEYYQLRQWDVATGLQTRASLENLGLQDVARDLEHRRLLAPLRQSRSRA
jgi:aldehyde:ferredoxin oxidoreductase